MVPVTIFFLFLSPTLAGAAECACDFSGVEDLLLWVVRGVAMCFGALIFRIVSLRLPF